LVLLIRSKNSVRKSEPEAVDHTIPQTGIFFRIGSSYLELHGLIAPDISLEIPDNIGASIIDYVPWICGCSSISVRNTGAEAIEIVSGNIIIDFAGIRR